MQRYLSKISGPLLDRIDIHIEVNPVPFEKLSEEILAESSKVIRARVTKARDIQATRFFWKWKYPLQRSNECTTNQKILRTEWWK